MRFLYIIFFIGFTNISANNLVEIVLPHNQWKLIGVSGAFMEGSGTGEITTASPWHWGIEYDVNVSTDSNYTGLKLGGTTAEYNSTEYSNYLAGFSVIESSYQKVTLSFNATGFSVDETLPRRKLYLDTTGNGSADTNISYQSDLEGETFNFKVIPTVGVASHYYGTFNSSYGEKNPMTLSKLTGTSSTYSFNIRDIIDMNLTNNPGKDGQSRNLYDYTESKDRDAMITGDDYLKVYRLDSTKSAWESFNSDTADSSNDFTTLTGGSAYWVKLYDKNEATKKHGLILGDGNISLNTYSSTYHSLSSENNTSRYGGHSLLASGWNMLSFPDGVIRYSGTGLILALSNESTNDKLTITDEVGKESIEIEIFTINSGIQADEVAKAINNQIAGAIEDGNLSKNFNIRAFSNNTDDNITIISDKKFRIYDGSGDIFGAVTTLAGQQPYDLATNSYSTISDLDTTGVASRYGEYALIVTVNNDGSGGTAGSILSTNQNIGKVQINSNTAIDISESTTGTDTVIGLDNKFSADDDISKDISLDLDLDSNIDSILLVSTSPFYIRDHTFTKVYRLDDNHSLQNGNPDIYIDTTGDGDYTTVTLSTGNTASDIVTDYTALTDIKSKDSGDYIYMTTVDSDYKDFDLKEFGTDDIFTKIISNDALALGSITKVYSISDLARSDVNKSIYSVTITTSDNSLDDNDDTLEAKIDSIDISDVADNGQSAGGICYDMKIAINSMAPNVYADCNTSDETTDKNLTAKLTITGYFTQAGIKSSSNEITLNGDGNNDYNYANDWNSASIGGVSLKDTTTLTDNLQYNPIYSPNYPTSDGILKYVRENGFEAEAILTAIDDGAGSISWKYTDLTAESDDWFNQIFDYSLFTTKMENGYFIRLSSKTSATITLTKNLNLDFFQHYNNDNNISGLLDDNGSVDNFFKGTLLVKISGDEGDNTQVIATIQNREYMLLKSGDSYSLYMTRDNFPEISMNDSNVTITVYDDSGNIEVDSNLELNLSSPSRPIAQFFNGKIIFLGTTSSDLGAFNIYSGRVDDRYATHASNTVFKRNLTATNDYKTATNYDAYYGNNNSELVDSLPLNGIEYNRTISTSKGTISYDGDAIGKVTRTDGNLSYYFLSYNLCEDAPDFDTNNSSWRVVTVDGDGDSTNSRVSNITFLDDWYAIYKNASILEVNASGGLNTEDSTPRLYGSDCNTSSDSNESQDNGVVLYDTNASKGDQITIAYDTISTSSIGTNIPHITNICFGGTDIAGHGVAKIQFAKNIYTTSLNTSLTSAKTLLIYYRGTINGTNIYKTDFDKLYAITDNTGCLQLDDNSQARIIGASGQTIIKGD